MTDKEFIKLAVSSGYCDTMSALLYTKRMNKETYTDDDFIEVYRLGNTLYSKGISNKKSFVARGVTANGTVLYTGGKTTKVYSEEE